MTKIATLFGLNRQPMSEWEIEQLRRARRFEVRALLAEIAAQ